MGGVSQNFFHSSLRLVRAEIDLDVDVIRGVLCMTDNTMGAGFWADSNQSPFERSLDRLVNNGEDFDEYDGAGYDRQVIPNGSTTLHLPTEAALWIPGDFETDDPTVAGARNIDGIIICQSVGGSKLDEDMLPIRWFKLTAPLSNGDGATPIIVQFPAGGLMIVTNPV